MRVKKNSRLILIDLIILCGMCYFLCTYAVWQERQYDYQVIPLTSVSVDSWYRENLISLKKGNGLLFDRYTLTASLDADVSDAEGIESIEIYTINESDDADGIVMIRNSSGKVLTTLSSCSGKNNRNTIYLYEKDGKTMLLTLRINFCTEWMYDYQYEIFHLDENNNPVLNTGSQCIFFISYPDSEIFPLAWMEELESYLSNAILLLSTEEKTLRFYSSPNETLPAWHPFLYQEPVSQ